MLSQIKNPSKPPLWKGRLSRSPLPADSVLLLDPHDGLSHNVESIEWRFDAHSPKNGREKSKGMMIRKIYTAASFLVLTMGFVVAQAQEKKAPLYATLKTSMG